MSPRSKLILFGGVCIVQLWAAASGIVKYERTLAQGTAYRFACAPVDPRDPFRGRYVQLQFAASQSALSPVSTGRYVYAALGTDAEGDAIVTALHAHRPEGVDSVRVRAYPQEDGTRVRFPFDRYFMSEHLAPEAERLYWESLSGADAKGAHLVVRVLHGQHAVEGLFIGDVPIEERLSSGAGKRPDE